MPRARSNFWKFWLLNELRRPQTWFLGLLIMVGISGVVFVDLFAQRVSKTSEQDARTFVSADFIVRSWRDFDNDLLERISRLVPREDQSWHRSLVASARDSEDQILNISLQAIDGAYPFYGKWKLEYGGDTRIESLRGTGEVFVEVALKTLGYEVGDTLEIGGSPFRIRDFVIEDPQSLDFMLFSAYRVWMHREDFEGTQLMGPGSRISNRLYLRKPDVDPNQFREEFRREVSDPNWRLRSAQQSDARVQRTVGLLKSFLSFVALCGTFLGLAGIFMIFVADLRQRLPQFLTLRCLGVREAELRKALLAPAVLSVVLASLLGALCSWILEARLASFLETNLNIALAADINPLRSFAIALVTGLVACIPALSTPIDRLMQIPVNRLFSGGLEASLLKSNLAPRSLALMGFIALGLATLLSGSIKLSVLNLLFVAGLVALLYLLARVSLSLLQRLRPPSFILSYLIKSLARQRERSLLWLLSLGFGFFFLLLGLMVSQSLQKQLRVADVTGSSNLVVMGSGQADLPRLDTHLPSHTEKISYLQARIYELNGEAIHERVSSEDSTIEDDGTTPIRVREYFVNIRDTSALYPGETLRSGRSLFGPPLDDAMVRASFELEFAQRMGLELGQTVQLDIAGIPIMARIVSLRSVDWFQFRPNFFIALAAEDLEGAPVTYLHLLRVADEEIIEWQSRLIKALPHLTTLDLRRTRDQISSVLDRLALAIQGTTAFLLLASTLVLLAIFLARRDELKNEFTLLRCLGIRAPQLTLFLAAESLLSGTLAWFGAFACALPGAWLLTRYGLNVSFSLPDLSLLFVTLIACVGLVLVANFALNRRLMTHPPQELFSEG
jgi:putative ABC transport system permease protein